MKDTKIKIVLTGKFQHHYWEENKLWYVDDDPLDDIIFYDFEDKRVRITIETIDGDEE